MTKSGVPTLTFTTHPESVKSDTSLEPLHILVFFITGNPGHIGYYEPFLRTLTSLLASSSILSQGRRTSSGPAAAPVRVTVHGQSLLGFSDKDSPEAHGNVRGEAGAPVRPFNLEEQVVHTLSAVESARAWDGMPFDATVLVGHSIGSYIATEIVSRLDTRRQQQSAMENTPHIPAAILLTPTVFDLARSRRGRLVTRIFGAHSLVDRHAHVVIAFLLSLLPRLVVWIVVRSLLGHPPHAASATVDWVKSTHASGFGGAWQFEFLGRNEMEVVREERWERGLWRREALESSSGANSQGVAGACRDKRQRGRWWMLWAATDGWIAPETRRGFLQRRKDEGVLLEMGDGELGPPDIEHTAGAVRSEVDTTGIEHDFCLRESLTNVVGSGHG